MNTAKEVSSCVLLATEDCQQRIAPPHCQQAEVEEPEAPRARVAAFPDYCLCCRHCCLDSRHPAEAVRGPLPGTRIAVDLPWICVNGKVFLGLPWSLFGRALDGTRRRECFSIMSRNIIWVFGVVVEVNSKNVGWRARLAPEFSKRDHSWLLCSQSFRVIAHGDRLRFFPQPTIVFHFMRLLSPHVRASSLSVSSACHLPRPRPLCLLTVH